MIKKITQDFPNDGSFFFFPIVTKFLELALVLFREVRNHSIVLDFHRLTIIKINKVVITVLKFLPGKEVIDIPELKS
jgi:hypothetical protein